MIKEFLQPKVAEIMLVGKEEDQDQLRRKKMKLWESVGSPQLSLGPSPLSFSADSTTNSSSNSDQSSEKNSQRIKRKDRWDHNMVISSCEMPAVQTSVELHAREPLPPGWEQCLDLQSGKMYYLNRKTLKKSWSWPKGHKLDLELNISTTPNSDERTTHMAQGKINSGGGMVAVACPQCHLLVMISKISPSCPNCKFWHTFPSPQEPNYSYVGKVKPLETLSLLN